MNVKIQSLFNKIALSAMFRLDGPPMDDLPAALVALAEAVHDHDGEDEIWSIGEFGEFSLDSLIVGAYWACVEWHGGQSSPSYAALCALGRVFSPGMTRPPFPGDDDTDEDPEYYPYLVIGQWFAAHPHA